MCLDFSLSLLSGSDFWRCEASVRTDSPSLAAPPSCKAPASCPTLPQQAVAVLQQITSKKRKNTIQVGPDSLVQLARFVVNPLGRPGQ